MRLTRSFFCLSLFFFLTAYMHAQNNENLGVLVDRLYSAMVEKDKAVLENLTAENLSYGHSSGTLENKNQYIEAVMTGPFEFISITPVDQTIEISGPTAIVRHLFVAKGINDGVDTDVRIGVLMAWQKQKGNWLLLARQAYKL